MKDPVVAMFEPDTMLPAQLSCRMAEWPGERRLMLAVLEEGVTTYFRILGVVGGAAERARTDAERWIDSEDRSWPFSFVNLCEAVDIEHSYFRAGLISAKSRGVRVSAWDWRRSSGRSGKIAKRRIRGSRGLE